MWGLCAFWCALMWQVSALSVCCQRWSHSGPRHLYSEGENSEITSRWKSFLLQGDLCSVLFSVRRPWKDKQCVSMGMVWSVCVCVGWGGQCHMWQACGKKAIGKGRVQSGRETVKTSVWKNAIMKPNSVRVSKNVLFRRRGCTSSFPVGCCSLDVGC